MSDTKKFLKIRSVSGFLILSACAILVSALTVAAQLQPDKRAEKLSRDAYNEFNKGNFKKAIENSDKAIRTQPKSPYAYYVKGWSQLRLGLYQQALTSLNSAVDMGQDMIDVAEPRGQVFYFLRDLANAEKDLVLFNDSPRGNGSTNLVLAQLYFEQKRYDQALPRYRKAAELGVQNKDIQYYIALCYGEMKDRPAQEKAAMLAVQNESQFKAEAYYQAGQALFEQKKYDQAIVAYDKAVQLKPIKEAYYDLYYTYRLVNRDEDAIAIMKRRTQEDPKDVQAFLNLSWISSLSDHPQDAVEAARQATKLAPTESVGFTNMCRAYNDLKLFDSAVQACTDALKIKPGDGETYFYMARAKYEQKKVGESQLLFERAAAGLVETTRQNPANADNFYLLGNAYYASNQTNKAIASYFKALEINPRYVKARYNLGLIYAQMGDYKSAKDQYNLLVALDQALAAKLLPKIEKPK